MGTLPPGLRDELLTAASTVLADYGRRHAAIETALQSLPALRETRQPFDCNCHIDGFERWLIEQREQVIQARTSVTQIWQRADEACGT